jgi:hypothetical protein
VLIRHNFTHETEPFSTRGVSLMNGEALQITLCRKHFRGDRRFPAGLQFQTSPSPPPPAEKVCGRGP